MVGDAGAREAWAGVLDGAVLVGRGRARTGSSRRGQGRSVTSNSCLWTQVLDTISGVYGAPGVECVHVLEAVIDVLSVGEVGGRGAACGVLAQGRALALSGHQWRDTGAGHTGSLLVNSLREEHGKGRWLRGVRRDKVGRLGSGCELAVEQGVRGGVRMFLCCRRRGAGDRGGSVLSSNERGEGEGNTGMVGGC